MLNELFTRDLITAEECSKVAWKGKWKQEGYVAVVLSTKHADVLQETCQVLEKHGSHVKMEAKSEIYYSSTLWQVVFQALHYANLIVAHAPTVWAAVGACGCWQLAADCFNVHLHHLLKDAFQTV